MIAIITKDGRGEILKVDADQPVSVKLSLKDLEQLKNLRALVSNRLQAKQDIKQEQCSRKYLPSRT